MHLRKVIQLCPDFYLSLSLSLSLSLYIVGLDYIREWVRAVCCRNGRKYKTDSGGEKQWKINDGSVSNKQNKKKIVMYGQET